MTIIKIKELKNNKGVSIKVKNKNATRIEHYIGEKTAKAIIETFAQGKDQIKNYLVFVMENLIVENDTIGITECINYIGKKLREENKDGYKS